MLANAFLYEIKEIQVIWRNLFSICSVGFIGDIFVVILAIFIGLLILKFAKVLNFGIYSLKV